MRTRPFTRAQVQYVTRLTDNVEKRIARRLEEDPFGGPIHVTELQDSKQLMAPNLLMVLKPEFVIASTFKEVDNSGREVIDLPKHPDPESASAMITEIILQELRVIHMLMLSMDPVITTKKLENAYAAPMMACGVSRGEAHSAAETWATEYVSIVKQEMEKLGPPPPPRPSRTQNMR